MNHPEYLDQLAAYVTGGLDQNDRASLEAHLATCDTCSAALAELIQTDETMNNLFATARPSADLEGRIIEQLRLVRGRRLILHPAVWRAATGLAAALVLGAVGYTANQLIQQDRLPFSEPVAMLMGKTDVVGVGQSVGAVTEHRSDKHPRRIDLNDVATQDTSFTQDIKDVRANIRGLDIPSDKETRYRYFENAAPKQLPGMTAMQGEPLPQRQIGGGDLNPRTVIAGAANNSLPRLGSLTDSRSAAEHTKGSDSDSDVKGNDLNATGRGLGRESDKSLKEIRERSSEWGALSLPMPEKIVQRLDAALGEKGRSQSGIVGDYEVLRESKTDSYFKPEQLAASVEHLSDGEKANYAEKTKEAGARADLMKKYPDVLLYPKDWSELNDQKLPKVPLPVMAQSQTGRSQVSIPPSQTFADAGGKSADDNSVEDFLKLRAAALKKSGANTVALQGQGANSGTQAPIQQPIVTRKIIRNGEMEFEVDGFDSAYLQISKIVTEEGGFVSSTNSEKLPNGKVRGTVVVRVPPDRLDTFVLKLRALGDLKGQKISAQDVTKHYTDLEGELKANRAMEERVLNIIKSGKGEIKDLLEAEKQLGVYREKIEKLEGEIRYYNNLISLSTLSITLNERDIRTAAFASQTEQVGMGIETEDVEKARAEAIKAIEEAKGRLMESNLKKFDAGQFAANIQADVNPDVAGPLIDRLKQLGRVARLDIDRKQTTPEGASAPATARVERKDTRFSISLYNLANIAPRQTTSTNMAVTNVEEAYKSILDLVKARNGRVITSSLNRQKPEQTTAALSFEVATADADSVLAEIRRDREVMMLTVAENPDTNNVTAAKRGFRVQLYPLAAVMPRETQQISIAAKTTVADAFQKLLANVKKADGRILISQLNEQDLSNVSGSLEIEVMRAKELEIQQALTTAGDTISRNVNRSTDIDNTVDSKVRIQIRLVGFEQLPPLETTRMTVEVTDVDKAGNDLKSAIVAAGGRVLDYRHANDQAGQMTTHVLANLPLAQAAPILAQLKGLGKSTADFARNPQAPAGEVARAQIDVTITSPAKIISNDQGLSAALKSALSTSIRGLLWSLQFIVIGLLFVGPWILLLWGGWKVLRRRTVKSSTPV